MIAWHEAIERFAALHPHRRSELFTKFLPHGYDLMTLPCVATALRHEAINAKCFLGMLITLYDDLADNPSFYNQGLLVELYKIPFSAHELCRARLSVHELHYVDFALFVAKQLMSRVTQFPGYHHYRELFAFDVTQFFNANNFYALMQIHPHLNNSVEARHFGPFNMGMVIAGTIDLMASLEIFPHELGPTRALLMCAQRYGQICNSVTTFAREVDEHTFTNEALVITKEALGLKPLEELVANAKVGLQVLRNERDMIRDSLSLHASHITSFDAEAFIRRLDDLGALHEQLRGII